MVVSRDQVAKRANLMRHRIGNCQESIEDSGAKLNGLCVRL
jgi:hypothetical protein